MDLILKQSLRYIVKQGSVLNPVLFSIYVNDLYDTIKFLYDFTLNKDLKEICFWLNANKISCYIGKKEVILDKAKYKLVIRN